MSEKLFKWLLVGGMVVIVGLLIFVLVGQKGGVGAYSTDATVLTDLHVTNDLVVDGVQTSSGSFVASTLTQGGGVRATSTSGTVVPLLASDFDIENVIDVTLNVSSATLSFPASSTLTSFIPVSGQVRELFIRNATTTASMNLTIAGGTGVLLKNASSTPSVSPIILGDTDGANYGVVKLIRKANTDIEALLTIFRD